MSHPKPNKDNKATGSRSKMQAFSTKRENFSLMDHSITGKVILGIGNTGTVYVKEVVGRIPYNKLTALGISGAIRVGHEISHTHLKLARTRSEVMAKIETILQRVKSLEYHRIPDAHELEILVYQERVKEDCPPKSGETRNMRPVEYDPRLFQARQDLIDLIREKAKQGRAHYVENRDSLICITGLRGSGKTTLANHLYNRTWLSKEEQEKSGILERHEHTLVPILYTCHAQTNAMDVVKTVARELIKKWAWKLDKSEQELLELLAELGTDEEWVQLFRPVLNRVTLLLLIDCDTNSFDPYQSALESPIIAPLLESNHGIVVIFAKQEFSAWRERTLQPRAANPTRTRLDIFHKVDIHDYIVKFQKHLTPSKTTSKTNAATLATAQEYLYRYSAGSPWMVASLCKSIHLANGLPKTSSMVIKSIVENSKELLNTYIERLLSGIDADLRLFLIQTTTLRYYRHDLLRDFLVQAHGAEPQYAAYYNEKIVRLTQAGLVRWNYQRNLNEPHPMLRLILNKLLMLQDSKQYIKEHNSAVTLFERMINEHAPVVSGYIIEKWYHHASLQFADNTEPTLTWRSDYERLGESVHNQKRLHDTLILDKEVRDLLVAEDLAAIENAWIETSSTA